MTNKEHVFESSAVRSRIKAIDYIELMKPELTGLSVLTALCGFFLASDTFDFSLFIWMGLGTLLVGGGAGALNQYIERRFDAMMKRTERRPLPAGRLLPFHVLIFGIFLSSFGILILALFTNILTAVLGASTLLSYLFAYTPMKRSTPWSTLVGGIPGALPPVMGWAAASNAIDLGALVLFGILFLWQMPHFLSLAWLYRKDYAKAGYKVLAVVDGDGSRTSRYTVLSLLALIGVSAVTSFSGITGMMYLAGSVILGVAFLIVAVQFKMSAANPAQQAATNQHSRQVFFASLVYLPALLFLMTVDKL